MNNILLVKNSLDDLELFELGINQNTILLKDPSIDVLLNSININTKHIGFVYHFQGYHTIDFFNDIDIDLIDNQKEYLYIKNSFLNLLQEIQKINKNIIFDLITCNITDDTFIKDLERLTEEYGFIFRYSNNETGYNGDWIQESHNISIKNIYFNNNIDNWNITLTTSRTIIYIASTYPSFFELSNNILLLKQNFDWGSNLNTNFITLQTGEIFDGQDNTINVNVLNFLGIFASSATSNTNKPIIRNLKVNNSSLGDRAGIIVRRDNRFFTVDNCHTTGNINTRGGGIAGYMAGMNNGNVLITNCSSTGNIGTDGGGIVGAEPAYGGILLITDCNSSGIINARGGGITGAGAVELPNTISQNITVRNCYSTGSIGIDAGGIVGHKIAQGRTDTSISRRCVIEYCNSIGNISTRGGGIAGSYFGSSRGQGTIRYCFSKGSIGEHAGGIAGHRFGSFSGASSIDFCYATGNVAKYGGGITGSLSGAYRANIQPTVLIRQCYHTGEIIRHGGGIAGSESGRGDHFSSIGRIRIENCYSTNNNSIQDGSLMGEHAGSSNGYCEIYNCYSLGFSLLGFNPASATTDVPTFNRVNGKCYIYNSVGAEIYFDTNGIISTTTSNSNANLYIINCSRNLNQTIGINNIWSGFANININNSSVFYNINWLNTNQWNFIGNNHPRLRNNFQILPNDDLSGSNLTGVNFNTYTFENVNMTNAILSYASFVDADLSSINLTNAILNNVNFTRTKLNAYDFTGLNLAGASFVDADLSGITLTNATLNNANFTRAKLNGFDFSNINLASASFVDAELTNLILTGSTLTNVNFTRAKLNDLNFTGLNLAGSSFIDVDLSDVILTGATLNNVNFTRAILNNLDFSGLNLSSASFVDADISGLILTGANLTNANLTRTNLKDFNLSNVNLTGVNLTDSITGPLTEYNNIILPSGFEIINDYIAGFTININAKLEILNNINNIDISNNTLIYINPSLLSSSLLGLTTQQKHNELLNNFNLNSLIVPENIIKVRNINKNGIWINANSPIVNIDILPRNENDYIYIANVPTTNITVIDNNKILGNVRKSGDNYIINDITYTTNQIGNLKDYRFTIDNLILEPLKLINNITFKNKNIILKRFDDLSTNVIINDNTFTNFNDKNNYMIYSGYRGGVIKFSITSNITNLSQNQIYIEFDLPNIINNNITLKLYKLNNFNFVIDGNYPKNVIYDTSINKWFTYINTLSDFIIVNETVPLGITGGDPYILNINTFSKARILPNTWKKVVLYLSSKFKIIGYNEKLKPEQMLKMKNYFNKEVEITKHYLSFNNFNYLIKMEIINLETDEILILNTFNGNIENNTGIIIEEIKTKNGLISVDKNYYFPKKNLKSYCIQLDNGNNITVKIDNYWIELNNIKLYINENSKELSGELINHNISNRL